MKMKLVIFAIVIIYGSNAFSQDDSATHKKFVIGGNLGFSSTRSRIDYQNIDKTSSFSVTPVFGIIAEKYLTIGLSLEYSIAEDNRSEYDAYDEKSWTALFFLRFNGRIMDKFQWYLEPGIGRKEFLIDTDGDRDKEWMAKIDFGILYFISNGFSLEFKVAGLDYKYLTYESDKSSTKTLNLHYDFVKPNIGLRYYF